jgi:hypothetical protein
MQGAVGLWLWSLPLQQRGGSISVWLSEDDLQRFVRWPVHLAIMRENRDTGRVRAATWHAELFVAADTWAEANVRLMSEG